jgi:hypothetical protein
MSRVSSLKDLSPDTVAAIRARKIEGAWDVRSLQKVLAELEAWDLTAELRKKSGNALLWIGVIGALFSIVSLFFMLGEVESWMTLLWPAGFFAAFVGAVVLGAKKSKAAQAMDLPDEIRVLVRPVVRQLSQDLDPKQKLKVDIDLQRIIENKPKSKQNLPPRAGATKLEQSLYEEPVCAIRMPLADGSEAVLRIGNEYCRTVRNYRGRSGKSKSKTKWKKYSTVTGILVPSPGMRWRPERIERFLDRKREKFEFVEKEGSRNARLDRYYKFASIGNPPANTAPLDEVMQVFLRLALMRGGAVAQ